MDQPIDQSSNCRAREQAGIAADAAAGFTVVAVGWERAAVVPLVAASGGGGRPHGLGLDIPTTVTWQMLAINGPALHQHRLAALHSSSRMNSC